MCKSWSCLFAALIIASLLAGCTEPPPEPVAVQLSPTETPLPSTSTSTSTLTATSTPTPTATPKITSTPTNTPTPTPLPMAGPVTENYLARFGKGWVNDLTFSPNGKMLSVATNIGVYLYRLDTMDLKSFLPTKAFAQDTVFIDDDTLIVGDIDGYTTVWDVHDIPRPQETLIRDFPVTKLGISGDRSILIFEYSNNPFDFFVNVVIWDRVNPENVYKVSSQYGAIAGISSPYFLLATGGLRASDIRNAILFDTTRMKAIATICSDCGATLSDTGIIAMKGFGENSNIVMYDISTKEELTSFQHSGFPAKLSSDGRLLAINMSDRLEVWDVTTIDIVNTFDGTARLVTFSPDNKLLASITGQGKLTIREILGGDIRLVVEGYIQIENPVVSNGYVASIDKREKKIIYTNIETGEIIRIFSPSEDLLIGGFSIILSDDGSTIASTWLTRKYEVIITLFDVRTGKQLISLSGGNPFAFSPDGSFLAYSVLTNGKALISGYSPGKYMLSYHSGQTRQLNIWNMPAREPLRLNQVLLPVNPYIKNLVISPNGQSIAILSEPIMVRELLNGKPMITLESGLNREQYSLSFEGVGPIGVFTPDGKILASTWLINTREQPNFLNQQKGVIILWDVVGGERLALLDGHADPTWGDSARNEITSLAISPNGSLLASGAEDKTIVIWSVQERRQIKVLEGHSAGINSLSFSSDGNYLYSGSSDGTVITWNMEHYYHNFQH
jgi:WD40 repeat protein